MEIGEKKTTYLLTSKQAILQALSHRCGGGHEHHCHLEGHASRFGRKTTYLENHQPSLAAVLAASIATQELPRLWEHGLALDEHKVATQSRGYIGILVILLQNPFVRRWNPVVQVCLGSCKGIPLCSVLSLSPPKSAFTGQWTATHTVWSNCSVKLMPCGSR